MLKSSVTNFTKFILLLPFGYAFNTRYHWPRDFGVNALTAWVPGIVLVSLMADLSLGVAIFSYGLGYCAFISLYEVGYLANDTIGLRHDATPRRRLRFSPSHRFIAIFVALRVLYVLCAALVLNVAMWPIFWGGLLALAFVLVAHNLLKSVEVKFFTFLQLSLFRFVAPTLPGFIVANDPLAVLVTFLTGLFLFSLPRFLTYLDAKGRLNLPERKAPTYHLKAHIAVSPLIVFLSAASQQIAPVICLGIGIGIQVIYVCIKRVRSDPKSKVAHP